MVVHVHWVRLRHIYKSRNVVEVGNKMGGCLIATDASCQKLQRRTVDERTWNWYRRRQHTTHCQPHTTSWATSIRFSDFE